MAITYVGNGSFVAYSSGQTISVSYPTGIQANDLAIFCVEFPDTISTLATGFNYIIGSDGNYFYATGGGGSGGWGVGSFYKFLAGTESGGSTTWGTVAAGTGNHMTGVMIVLRGVNTTTPFFNSSPFNIASSASSSFTIPATLAPNAPSTILTTIGTHASSGTGQVTGFSNTNYTSTQRCNFSSSSPAGGIAVYTSDFAGNGSTGTSSGTLSSSQLWGAMSIPLHAAAGNTIDVVQSSGTGTVTVPTGVTTALVECWGGGAGGESFGTIGQSDGGGGGAYAAKTISVTAGASVSYQVGAGGGVATNGSDTWFVNSTTVLAKGGSAPVGGSGTRAGGTGGQASACIGDIKASGGNGSACNDGGTGATQWQGAGGGSAGSADGYTAVAGNNAVQYTPGAACVSPAGLNSGGGGVATNGTVIVANINATGPGGGGATDGNVGMAGQIRITWNPTAPAPSYKQTLILSI